MQRPLPDNTQHSQERGIHDPLPPTGFEPTIPASERPETHTLDRMATGIGTHLLITKYISKLEGIRTPCNVNTRM